MMGKKHNYLHQTGFSLVELMVALVIGLLATLVIMQVFSAFEGQKRSTSGTADAQTNGSIALMNIQRNVQMAGYGLPLPNSDLQSNALRCNALPNFTDPVTANITNIFPIQVQDGGGSNASDTITVRYSTTARGAIPVEIIDPINAAAGTGLVADSNMGCVTDDIAVIINNTTCAMTKVADADGSGNTPVNISLYAAVTPSAGTAPLVAGAKIACMGNWQNYTFQVVNDELQLNGQPIVSEVVNMQVQYGVSAAAGSNDVTAWVNATGGTWGNPIVASRNRIKAIRVAVVLRNGLLEKANVTNAALTAWTPLNGSAAPVIDLTGIPNWQQYRYRVFETIIPLRNMLWSKDAVA